MDGLTLSPSDRVIALEQCSICSGHYEQPRRCFVQPDVNRLICKVLDVAPAPLPDGSSYFASYVPVCLECTRKLRKFDKLRVELEVLKREVITSVVDTLVHIRSTDETPLNSLKQQVVSKWVTREGNVELEQQEAAPTPRTPVKPSQIPTKFVVPPIARVITPKSPPRTPQEYIQRQQNFGRTPDLTQIVEVSEITSQPNPHPIHTNPNWVNEVSIVADNETEAQEILAAYVAANINNCPVPEAAGDPPTTAAEENDGFTAPDADDVYFESGTGYVESGDSDIEEVTTTPAVEEEKEKPKGKRRTGKPKRKPAVFDPNKPKRKPPAKFEKVPQHEKPPFFCENCGRVYLKLGTLRSHALLCAGGDAAELPIDCPMCTTDPFDTWLGLKFHIDEVHPLCGVDKCRFCRKEYLPNTIMSHKCVRDLTYETGDPATMEPFKCTWCDKVYYKEASLAEHFRRHHSREPRFPCQICHRQFGAESLLHKHMRSHTVGTKTPFKCEHCGISTTTRWGLREHMKLHTGERPHVCEVCGKTFRLANIKRNHMVTHTGERNYSCELCGKTFTLYATMLRHWKKCRNPPGPKRGKWCPICLSEGILYQRLKSLKDHMMRKHPGTREQFQICSEEGNRDFGYEEQDEEELKRLRSVRPDPKIRPPPRPKNPAQEAESGTEPDPSSRRSGRKRKPTRRAIEGDEGEGDESILPDIDGDDNDRESEEEEAEPAEPLPVRRLSSKRRGRRLSKKAKPKVSVKEEPESASESEEPEGPKRSTSMMTRGKGLKKVGLDSYVDWINQDKGKK